MEAARRGEVLEMLVNDKSQNNDVDGVAAGGYLVLIRGPLPGFPPSIKGRVPWVHINSALRFFEHDWWSIVSRSIGDVKAGRINWRKPTDALWDILNCNIFGQGGSSDSPSKACTATRRTIAFGVGELSMWDESPAFLQRIHMEMG